MKASNVRLGSFYATKNHGVVRVAADALVPGHFICWEQDGQEPLTLPARELLSSTLPLGAGAAAPGKAPIDRAFALLARLSATATPARALSRAASKLVWLARNSSKVRSIYWLSVAVLDHKHALAAAALGDEALMADHVVRRDRSIELFAHRATRGM